MIKDKKGIYIFIILLIIIPSLLIITKKGNENDFIKQHFEGKIKYFGISYEHRGMKGFCLENERKVRVLFLNKNLINLMQIGDSIVKKSGTTEIEIYRLQRIKGDSLEINFKEKLKKEWVLIYKFEL